MAKFIPSTNMTRLSIAALGVVFGDIGTSPLYAFRESLIRLPIMTDTVAGVLSLIFWSLIIVVVFKYLVLVLRADNQGEGGVLALMSLLKRYYRRGAGVLLLLAILGTSLIIGDGMLTPSITVLSAIEGIKTVSPFFTDYVIPSTIVILVSLFWFQRRGTGNIGNYFGPVILVWFITIAILGICQIVKFPRILIGLNPYYAIHLFFQAKMLSFVILGGVFLTLTGAEALYADIGHFGKNPIRLACLAIVIPALVLNYFGQGAYILHHPHAITNPFYAIAPVWFLPILVIIATMAAIIASQAIISAVFSIMKQAVLLNLIPRTKIIHTSEQHHGQVYLPTINLILGAGTLLLVLMFKSSSALAHAYGIAVNLDMILTTVLVSQVALLHWRWPAYKALPIFILLFIVDASFLTGNLHKFLEGGWFPIVVALIVMIVMSTWHRGYERLRVINYHNMRLSRTILEELDEKKIRRLPGTALFITDPYDEKGGSLLHHLKINRILTKIVVFVTVIIRDIPYVPTVEKFELSEKAQGFFQLNVYYGFAEDIDLPEALKELHHMQTLPFELDLEELSYFVEMISVDISRKKDTGLFYWQKCLFGVMLRNALPDIQFYCLPYNRTVAIGTYCQL